MSISLHHQTFPVELAIQPQQAEQARQRRRPAQDRRTTDQYGRFQFPSCPEQQREKPQHGHGRKIPPAKLLRLTEGLHSLPDKPESQPAADYPGTQVCTQKIVCTLLCPGCQGGDQNQRQRHRQALKKETAGCYRRTRL